jgi:hypothetical protein
MLRLPAHHHLRFPRRARGVRGDGVLPAQERADAFHQKTLRKRLAHVIVGAHAQAHHLVDLIILGGEEDHRHLGFLAQALQQIHAVHARHLDVEHAQIRKAAVERVKRGLAIVVGFDVEALGLERHRDGRQNIPVVVDKCNPWHRCFLVLPEYLIFSGIVVSSCSRINLKLSNRAAGQCRTWLLLP